MSGENDFQSDHPILLWTLIVAALLSYCGFLSSLQSLLNRVEKSNRQVNPWSVWLLLVPVVNIVWQFILVNAIADSLRMEFDIRKTPLREERPGYDLGLLMCLFNCTAILGSSFHALAVIPFVLWIAYWVKVGYFRKLLLRPRQVKDFGGTAAQNSSGNLELFRDKLE